MGGSNAGDWILHPEECAVLIGTQDMLLSRALNRGYAAPRARWPMEFGLLNSDCLWIMDEVQLMDVGLATSAQLQQFRDDDRAKGLRPCLTWWMSATLQPDWLASVDTKAMVDSLRGTQLRLAASARDQGLCAVQKPCALRSDVREPKAWADAAWDAHRASADDGHGRITLVVANTVKAACAVHAELAKLKAKSRAEGVDLRLVHSRFRGHERAAWREAFLCRDACANGVDRIIVATQVVEAGVDISATALVTELAPWPSLVQRFGRVARYGGSGRIIVLDRALTGKSALPYRPEELSAASAALADLPDVSLASLEAFEEHHPELLPILYPYAPLHLLLRRELDELFDTSPDLTGADIDISRFIRSGEERDVLVFWRDAVIGNHAEPGFHAPCREELCPVAIGDARKWLAEGGAKGHAWVWEYLDGQWRRCRPDDIYPGQTILVDASAGGYDRDFGWTGLPADKPEPLACTATQDALSEADAAATSEVLSETHWKTVVTHGREADAEAEDLASALNVPSDLARLLRLSLRWHDVGKTHPAFAGCIDSEAPGHPQRTDLAKAPPEAWRNGRDLYRLPNGERRPGFRHELASVLALFGVLRRCHPAHPALTGPFQELLAALGQAVDEAVVDGTPSTAEGEILALDRASFDLLAYLVCAHHGKLRAAWHASPDDQDYRDRDGRGMPIRGIRAGDALPEIPFADSAGDACTLPTANLILDPAAIGLSRRTGPSWVERVECLLRHYGPFTLAYLEAIVRISDIRASRLQTPDPLLPNGGAA
ncbi:MAG: hypothetical protein GX595_17315 [Lentisphaerae bacterium]|nr:hypothetical protein [Lentisphaerota bacterium]